MAAHCTGFSGIEEAGKCDPGGKPSLVPAAGTESLLQSQAAGHGAQGLPQQDGKCGGDFIQFIQDYSQLHFLSAAWLVNQISPSWQLFSTELFWEGFLASHRGPLVKSKFSKLRAGMGILSLCSGTTICKDEKCFPKLL